MNRREQIAAVITATYNAGKRGGVVSLAHYEDRILSIGLDTCPHRGKQMGEQYPGFYYCDACEGTCKAANQHKCYRFKAINAAIKGE